MSRAKKRSRSSPSAAPSSSVDIAVDVAVADLQAADGDVVTTDVSATATFGMEPAVLSRMANRLALEALRALRLGRSAADVATALRAFVDTPLPHTFVIATRALRTLRHEHALSQALAAQRDRRYQQALELLRSTSTAGEVLSASLATGVRDAKAPARLTALAYLIASYEELESRAQQERDALRTRLGY